MEPQDDKKVIKSTQEKKKFSDNSIRKQIQMLKEENLNLKKQVSDLKSENEKLQKNNNQN